MDITIKKSPVEMREVDNIVFNSYTEGSGNDPNYEWFINGIKQEGENSDTLSGTYFQDEDEVYCKFTSSSDCAENNPTISNTIQLQTDPLRATPQEIMDNTIICHDVQQSEYITLDLANADNIIWTAQPSQAYDTIQCLNDICQTISIKWNVNRITQGEENTVLLWVKGHNENCGSGQYINPRSILTAFITPM